MNKKHATGFFFAVLFLSVASPAHATVLINEIDWMGTALNANAEWIELFNSGATDVSLDGWTLTAQSGTPHVTLAGTITAGGFFLLERTSDATVPGITADEIYTGALTNAGDTLTLKDAAGVVSDQVIGGANWANVGGSNVSKQPAVRTSGGWTTAASTPRSANPGNIAADAPIVPGAGAGAGGAATSSDSSVTSTISSGGAVAPLMNVDAGGDRTVETGAGSFFEGQVYNKDGIPMPDARYLWNFGDGDTSEGRSVFYAYPYPGRYVVLLFTDAGNGYSTSARIIVDVVPAEVAVAQKDDGSVAVSNLTHSRKELDLGMWKLESGGSVFVIPRGTIALPGMAVRFAPSALKLPVATSTLLLYPDGMVAAHTGELDIAKATGITYEPIAPVPAASSVQKVPSSPVSEAMSSENSQSTVGPVASPVDVSVSVGKHMVIRHADGTVAAVRDQTASPEVVTDVPAVNGEVSSMSPAVDLSAPVAAAGNAPIPGELSPTELSAAGASALVLLGAAGVLYSRPRPLRPVQSNDSTDFDDSDVPDGDEESEPDLPPNKDELRRRADALAEDFIIRDTTKT